MPLFEAFTANNLELVIKFYNMVRISSITLDRFALFKDGATPIPVPDPFTPIDIATDYNSISRTLILYFQITLEPSTAYIFTAEDLLAVNGAPLPIQNATWTTGTEAVDLPTVPPEEPVVIEDHSVRSAAFLNTETVYAANPDFYIVSTDPEENELMVEADHDSGRVNINFSSRPGAAFINDHYFRAQRKLVQRAPSRWEDVEAEISRDSIYPIVYVDFPSTDASPVYGIADREYFPPGYKYRVRIAKEVGP